MKKQYTNKYIIETGIGLQDVDGLKNSSYFINESKRYIRGEITLEELDSIINSYYENKPLAEDRSDEADKVSTRIGLLVSEDSFTFTPGQLLSIHRTLFQGILKHPGELRTCNISKKEWVLDDDSVTYGDYRELKDILLYDFEQEKKFQYKGLTIDQVIDHLAIFISNLWQIHAFAEGNTRTTAVFVIKYLRRLGFDVTNDIFAKNAQYFRNALVRANYTNINKGIYEDRSYLVLFLRNLLLNEKNELKNRNLHISPVPPTLDSSKTSLVLSFIKNYPRITTEELAEQIGASTRTIKSILKTLVLDKEIKRVNGKRYGYWKVKEK